MWCIILLIYSSLYPENIFTEATHAWVLVVKLVWRREGSVVFKIFLLDNVSCRHLKCIPCLRKDLIHLMTLKKFFPIIQHTGLLCINLIRLHFSIWPIIFWLVVSRVNWFQYKGLDILVLCVTNCAVVKMDVMYTEENYFIVDSGGGA